MLEKNSVKTMIVSPNIFIIGKHNLEKNICLKKTTSGDLQIELYLAVLFIVFATTQKILFTLKVLKNDSKIIISLPLQSFNQNPIVQKCL